MKPSGRFHPDPLVLFVILVNVFILMPTIIVILLSFTPSSFLRLSVAAFSLRWYKAILQRPLFIEAFIKSASLGFFAALISVCLGGVAAYLVTRVRSKGAYIADALFTAPVIVPSVVIAIALLQFLTSLRINGTFSGLLIGHVVVTMPYVVRVVSASLKGLDRNLELAAMNLGAGWLETVWFVILPLIRPGILAGMLFAFIVSFDNLVVSLFLAGPRDTTLPLRIFIHIQDMNDPLIAAVSSSLIGLSLIFIVALERLAGIRKLFTAK